MLKILAKPYFTGSVFTYGIIRFDRVTDCFGFSEFIRYNFNDFLCLPIVLTLTVCVLTYITKQRSLKLSPQLIFGEAIFYSILFELVLPIYASGYTADFMDVLMYFSGAFFYYYVQEEPELQLD